VNPLVLVALTPCRIVDTRASQGFPSPFGVPSLVAGASRTFALPSSTLCKIPAAAQAYSLNITVVPSTPAGFITAYPTGQPLPLAATLVWSQGSFTSNAAIVPGGTSGSIDVYTNSATDIVIDINGYYVADGYVPTGDSNTASGAQALGSNTTGNGNTASGAQALGSNTTGNGNTASGSFALLNNTTGGSNTASGSFALQGNTTGNGNTASGTEALLSNTTGGSNTASGFLALGSNTTGNGNTASGFQALGNNTTGNNNIAIGNEAAIGVATGNSNNIHIGSVGASDDNGTIRIGGNPGAQTRFFVTGVSATGVSGVPVLIDTATGQLGVASSSRRYKEDIQDMGDASSGLMRLRPVTFRYQKHFADGSKPIQYGLIAEEVAEIYPDLVVRGADGQIETVKYQVLDSLLLNEVQRQEAEIRALKERLAQLESKLP
jgi:hypothetical protein